nr:MAG TPA: hypothetical protein [Caudoviricetes sp.]
MVTRKFEKFSDCHFFSWISLIFGCQNNVGI